MLPLPVHGFVLAGGKSSRMGQDKALMNFRGRPMIRIAVEKLKAFCAEVSIVGNRDDLRSIADVVHEERIGEGPAAGIEAGLMAATQPWVMFVPVDVPLVPAELLQRWAEEVLARGDVENIQVSHLSTDFDQPTFCMLRRDCLQTFVAALEGGNRRMLTLLSAAVEAGGVYWVYKVEGDAGGRWFANVNTPEDMAEAEA